MKNFLSPFKGGGGVELPKNQNKGYCDFWEALSPLPPKRRVDDTMGLHPQMNFSLKSPEFL